MRKYRKWITTGLFLIFAICANVLLAGSIDPVIESQIKIIFKHYKGDHIICISKKDFNIYVCNRDLSIAVSYKIGYGLNPDKKAKLCAGDNRTPEGIYSISEILSLDADKKTVSYKKLRDMNTVYFKANEGHYKFGKKDIDLGYNAYGPRFFRVDYPNNNDKKRYDEALIKGLIPKFKGKTLSIGSGIAIHGTSDDPSIGQLASSGCIRMHNNDIINLDKYVKLNIPVVIY
ncbi:MAG: L,D-transpeptidase [Spirochaetota bacterium]